MSKDIRVLLVDDHQVVREGLEHMLKQEEDIEVVGQSANGEEVLAHLSGKLRLHRIKILNGDKVLVELSSYDPTRGRIIYRL